MIEKRITPTVRIWNPLSSSPAAGSVNLLLNSNADAAVLGAVNSKAWTYLNSGSGGFSTGSMYQFQFDANADF